MKLENQLVNLELSEKMKELGFEQESVYFWVKVDGRWLLYRGKGIGVEEEISAFSVAELGEMLPKGYHSFQVNPEWVGYKIGKEWCCMNGDDTLDEYADTEANDRAKMLIYLRENKLI